ncbi:hypothetical protein GPECTOR_75g761 [Gonium pectorale]|uniref:Uncharacterized protein n=1 Tax=Gonium pectorale TaxID=33097 RepID=A0A150G2G1_GONPE|nr:hypothetical protein GPECTOR_75g761 [Gonium pectorale]|eukprot:KXZ44037.1 hypothetical protein GPECTOR_75g761 [Gonium pectorale]
MAGEADFSFPRPGLQGGAASDPPGRSASGSASSPFSLPATASSSASVASSSAHGQPPHGHAHAAAGQLAAEFSYGVFIEGGEGPLLDPRRNDDLPPRPGTSRGRPGSAALSDMDPITERYPGPPPGVQDMGNGAQVLDLAAFAQYSDDEDEPGAIAARASSSTLCGHTGKLVGLVEEMRRREGSSRWLNSASSCFRDGSGVALTMREAIAEHVFRLMDSSNSELLMKACAVVLRVVKSRQPLLQAAKLLYRLSKDGQHDPLFRREGLLEPLLHSLHIMVASARCSSNPANMHEVGGALAAWPLVYMSGTLKNISNEPSNQRSLIKLGALHVLAALLQQLAEQAKSGDDTLSDSCGQVAVQASGVLRNLAVPTQNAQSFLAAGVLPALRAACSGMSTQVEVVLNVGRILSKLSLHEGCQAAMAEDTAYAPLLVQLLGQYADNRAILLRVAFVLGNLTTHSNQYREQVCDVPFSLVTVVGVLQRYAFGGPPSEGAGGGSSATDRLSRAASHEDCLVKLLRLTANLAIWPPAGTSLAEEEHVAGALLALLEGYSFEGAEELVLNTVCALTNLSFYQSDPAAGFTNKVLCLPAARLLPRITPLLMCDNEEAVIEAARVYGNFSRSPDVRDYMQATRIVDALVLLLDHSNSEVLYSVCGTLVNFTMDASRRAALCGLGGVGRLVELLGRTVAQGELSERDEALVEVVCKALFNVASADEGDAAAAAMASGSSGGADGGASSSFSREEVGEVLGIVELLEGSAVAEGEEMGSVLGRLAGQMRRLQQRMSCDELEVLPE